MMRRRKHPHSPIADRRPRSTRRGTILIVTMWIIMVLAAMVLVLARNMRVEAICSANGVSAFQSASIEDGAIQYVLEHLDGLQGQVPTSTSTSYGAGITVTSNAQGQSSTSTDMPCQAVRIGDGAFWIICPNFEDDHSFAYGVVDEASKVNLNTATLDMLSMLPDMTGELEPCIYDWRSGPDTPASSGGAKSEYYGTLSDPYQCKSAAFETVNELFLVKGATKELLYGEDANLNGVLDPNEDDADTSEPQDNRDGHLDRGLIPFVTVYSVEDISKASDGSQRFNVSSLGTNQAQSLANLLGQFVSRDRASAIVARVTPRPPAPRQPPPQPIRYQNILQFYYRSRMMAAEFAAVADKLTTSTTANTRGLINVSTAPQQVLACLPGLDENDTAALVGQRAQPGVDLTNIAWVTQVLSQNKAIAIGSLITARSYQFSADIVSVAGDGRAFKRCRIVVDARTSPPKVIYRQDLTQLGWPLEASILSDLRSGVGIDKIVGQQSIFQETR